MLLDVCLREDTISNLQCRTTEFVSKAGLSTWVPSQAWHDLGGAAVLLRDLTGSFRQNTLRPKNCHVAMLG